MQQSLFENSQPENIPLRDGQLWLYRSWLPAEQAQALCQVLQRELAWEQPTIRIAGKKMPIPRLNAWYGDSNASYGYSGISLRIQPWTGTLLQIKSRLENTPQPGSAAASNHPLEQKPLVFNSVLANLYRDGQDSVAWHSDDEQELGENPLIASISLGAERRFSLRHKYRRNLPIKNLYLPNGSLLLMAGKTQHFWCHQLPKTRSPVGVRINLTFRQVYQLSQ